MNNFFKIGNSSRKIARTLTRVLTRKQAEEMSVIQNAIVTIARQLDSGNYEYQFVSSHGLPPGYSDDWIPATQGFPSRAVEREGVPGGLIDTLAKFEIVYHSRDIYKEVDVTFPLLTPKDFFDYYATYTVEKSCKDLSKGLARYFCEAYSPDDYNLLDSEMEDDQKAFWYIATNYIDFGKEE